LTGFWPPRLDIAGVSDRNDHLLKATGAATGGARSRVNDLTTYFGSWRAVCDPTIAMPPAGHAFTDINNWPQFLEMGSQPGVPGGGTPGGRIVARQTPRIVQLGRAGAQAVDDLIGRVCHRCCACHRSNRHESTAQGGHSAGRDAAPGLDAT